MDKWWKIVNVIKLNLKPRTELYLAVSAGCVKRVEAIYQLLATLDQNQNEIYWPGMFTHTRNFYSDRSSTVQQNDSDRTQTTKEQYTNIQMGNVQNGKNTIYNTCVRSDVQIWNEINKYVWWINNCVVCSTFNVKCPWDGLLGERNGFCVWSFWCSDLCSVDQTVIVKRGSVLDVRCPE